MQCFLYLFTMTDDKILLQSVERAKNMKTIKIHIHTHASTYMDTLWANQPVSRTNNNSCQVEVVLGLFQSLQFWSCSQLLKWQWKGTNRKEMDWIWTWMLLLFLFLLSVSFFFIYMYIFVAFVVWCIAFVVCVGRIG